MIIDYHELLDLFYYTIERHIFLRGSFSLSVSEFCMFLTLSFFLYPNSAFSLSFFRILYLELSNKIAWEINFICQERMHPWLIIKQKGELTQRIKCLTLLLWYIYRIEVITFKRVQKYWLKTSRKIAVSIVEILFH